MLDAEKIEEKAIAEKVLKRSTEMANVSQEMLASLASPELVGRGELCTERFDHWVGSKAAFRSHRWTRDHKTQCTACTECPGRVADSALMEANGSKP